MVRRDFFILGDPALESPYHTSNRIKTLRTEGISRLLEHSLDTIFYV
jgi:hypothetical protein